MADEKVDRRKTMPHLFKKGQSFGRPPGRPNKFRLEDVARVLGRAELNPTEEILKLIPLLEPRDQAKTWFWLLAYTQPRPAAIEMKTIEAVNEIAEKMESITSEELAEFIKKEPSDVAE
jgi:hypothetical protein